MDLLWWKEDGEEQDRTGDGGFQLLWGCWKQIWNGLEGEGNLGANSLLTDLLQTLISGVGKNLFSIYMPCIIQI